jgi:hypothetical protein
MIFRIIDKIHEKTLGAFLWVIELIETVFIWCYRKVKSLVIWVLAKLGIDVCKCER